MFFKLLLLWQKILNLFLINSFFTNGFVRKLEAPKINILGFDKVIF